MTKDYDMDMTIFRFPVGVRVIKSGEDSKFEGEVVASFMKRNKKTVRFVVENDDGVLHIASANQLKRSEERNDGLQR